MNFERVIIIRDQTRLEQLIERFNSKAQAKFYIERNGGDFQFFELENTTFYESLAVVQEAIPKEYKQKIIYRTFLPRFLFAENDLILVIGQDGLVANTAKYVNGLPIIGINPDRARYDGILLKHDPTDVKRIIKSVAAGKFNSKKVTLAKATMNDGQTLLAFNDFYVGADSHVSSRYTIDFNGAKENQSSSGILISTGAGSTGWLSSVFNMTNNINRTSHNKSNASTTWDWDEEKLVFVVREPFVSKMSQATIGFGIISKFSTLRIESHMPTKGVIFSDGIESDFIKFNTGSTVEIGIAKEKALLIE